MKVGVNLGPAQKEDAVRVFQVKNTSWKYLYVLALDEQEALSIAWTAGHIYTSIQDSVFKENRRYADEVKSPIINSDLERLWSCVCAARARGVRGTLEFRNDHVLIGAEMFASPEASV